MNRSGLAKAPTKDELNKRYEMVINQPPPPPAYATKPPPMTLREGRNCSITVRVKLPNGSDVRIPLDLNDVLNDVRAAVEAQSKYSGVELLVFHSDHEVRNTTMTVKEMGITNGEVIEVKLDTVCIGGFFHFLSLCGHPSHHHHRHVAGGVSPQCQTRLRQQKRN